MLPCKGARLGTRASAMCSGAAAVESSSLQEQCPRGKMRQPVPLELTLMHRLKVNRLWVRAPHMMQDVESVRIEA